MNCSTKCAPTTTSAAIGKFCLSLLSLLLLVASAAYRNGQAATICIAAGDIAGLQTALGNAAIDGQDDLIELQSGLYDMPSNYVLSYAPSAIEQRNLKIEGGYSDFFGNPCGLAPASPDPRTTVLNGGLFNLALPSGAGSITLQSITISNTVGNPSFPAPVYIFPGSGSSIGDIVVNNSMFTGNTGTGSAAILIRTQGGVLSIHNSIFALNASLGNVPIYFNPLRTDDSICTMILDSTFTGNSSSAPAVEVFASACRALVANDIFWGNSNGDVYFVNAGSTYLANSDFGDLAETANTQSTELLSVDPLFNPDFSLRDLSPLRDKGSLGGFVFSPGPYDVIGNPRIYGANPDIGAYEIQDVIFADGFDF